MKIKVFNLHKQFGNGKGDVIDWTSKQVTIENGILKSSDGGTSSKISTIKNIPNKNVTIYVTESGSVYVTSTEQPHRSHGIAGAARRLQAASSVAELHPLQRPPRVPSGRSGQILVSDLQSRNDYKVYVANLSAPFQGEKDKNLVKEGLEAIIIANGLNYNTVYKMLMLTHNERRNTFNELKQSLDWWDTIYQKIKNQ